MDFPALWENKALGAASWKEVVKKGVVLAKPIYAAQIALYQAYLDLPSPALFTALKLAERFTLNTLNSFEDAIVKMATTGKLEWKGLVDAIVADLIRSQARQLLGGLFSGLFGGGGLFGGSGGGLFGSLFGSASSGATSSAAAIYHAGGPVDRGHAEVRHVPAALFATAPRLHRGGVLLRPDEMPAILQTGERVLSRREARAYEKEGAGRPPVMLTFNVTTPDAASFWRAQSQITADLASALRRAERNL